MRTNKENSLKISSASRLLSSGNFEDAERFCGEVVRERPTHLKARVLRTHIRMRRSAAKAAIKQLQTLSQVEDPSPKVLYLLSIALRWKGDKEEAMFWAKKAAEGEPDSEIMAWLGQCQFEAEEYLEAERSFRRAVELGASKAAIQNALGACRRSLGRISDSIGAFEAAVNTNPSSITYRANLIDALLLDNEAPRALGLAHDSIEKFPDSIPILLLYAQALASEGRSEEAESKARAATILAPTDPSAHACLGFILQVLGKLDEAAEECERSIILQPRQGVSYYTIAHGRKLSEKDRPFVDQMIALKNDSSLEINQRGHLAYGLGKAYEDLGEFYGAMECYDEANRIAYMSKFGQKPFNMDINATAYESTKITYSEDFINTYRSAGSRSKLPIFVIGMMRSGTTLLEQMLSSHKSIGPAGEQRFWPLNRLTALSEDRQRIDSSILNQLTEEYCSRLHQISPGSDHVVDKMPANYMHVGLLRIAYPSAKIIHISRNPLDTCLSIYATQNRARIQWAHDKDNIAINYLRYLDLMEHWQTVLPPDSYLDVKYEMLVSDPAGSMERILGFLGLSWDEACLSPEKNERGVFTPSLCQVRQPIYKTSVNRWRRFEPWLGGLNRLRPLVDDDSPKTSP